LEEEEEKQKQQKEEASLVRETATAAEVPADATSADPVEEVWGSLGGNKKIEKGKAADPKPPSGFGTPLPETEPLVSPEPDRPIGRHGRFDTKLDFGPKLMPPGNEASGSGRTTPLRASAVAGQDFSDVHNAGHSRNHYGNVYHTTYQNFDRPACDGRDQSDDDDDDDDFDDVATVKLDEVDPKQQSLVRAKAREMMEALAFDGMGDRHMTISPACIDTCSWFLQTQEYARWRDPAHRHSHKGVLWIKGNAGSGKSTLMRYIHDHAQKQRDDTVTVAFFYNGRSAERLVKSTEGMYRSVIHQLYNRIPRLGAAAAQRFSATTQRPWSLVLLEELIREAVVSLTADEKVTCYIDALDECELDQVRSAVSFFEQLSESATLAKTHFRLCLASRYYPQITMQAHEEVKIDAMPMHLLDISKFVTSRLTIPPASKLDMQAEIQKRCSGNFMWVVVVVELLREKSDRGATRSQLHETLKSLPEQLDALFSKISESADVGYAVAMRWLLFAERMLSPTELYLAIQAGSGQLDPDDWNTEKVEIEPIRRYILHVSRGLIEIKSGSKHRGVVQFIHESVREHLFLRGCASTALASRQKWEAMSHARMAEDCQSYLKFFHARGSASIEMENILRDYVLHYVFKHIELAYTGNAIDFATVLRFPTREYVALHDTKTSSYEDYILPGHTASFLMLLIEHKCYALAEVVLQRTTQFDHSAKVHFPKDQTFAKAVALTRLDLSTPCGGLWGSPLHAAVHAEKKDLVHLLLDKGANINCCGEVVLHGVSQEYDSPSMLALEHGTPGMVQLLLDRGACVNTLSPKNGFNALHRACRDSDHDMVKFLLDRGADVSLPCRTAADWTSFRGSTALHLAVCGHRSTMVHSLLAAGGNVDATDADGKTALMLAISRGSNSHVKLLLQFNANMDTRDGTSQTAIEAANSCGHTSIVKMLLSETRSRALKGRSQLQVLPISTPPDIPERRRRCRIPAPARSQSQRTEIKLQYRRLLPHQPKATVAQTHQSTKTQKSSGTSQAGMMDYREWSSRGRSWERNPYEWVRPPAPSPPRWAHLWKTTRLSDAEG
jgi:hypothetical protein